MSVFVFCIVLVVVLGFVGLLSVGCIQFCLYQGYVVDVDFVNLVQFGVDNCQLVFQMFGKLIIVGQFDQGDWYYVVCDSCNFVFCNLCLNVQIMLQISFDQNGMVIVICCGGLDQVVLILFYGKIMLMLGCECGFFQDLFGNIGMVGVVGVGGGQGGGVGGGCDQL